MAASTNTFYITFAFVKGIVLSKIKILSLISGDFICSQYHLVTKECKISRHITDRDVKSRDQKVKVLPYFCSTHELSSWFHQRRNQVIPSYIMVPLKVHNRSLGYNYMFCSPRNKIVPPLYLFFWQSAVLCTVRSYCFIVLCIQLTVWPSWCWTAAPPSVRRLGMKAWTFLSIVQVY